jgi:hypothetical protein
MAKNNNITPALNEKIVIEAGKIYASNNGKSRKDWESAYNTAIKNAGYNVAYFKKCMREIGANEY